MRDSPRHAGIISRKYGALSSIWSSGNEYYDRLPNISVEVYPNTRSAPGIPAGDSAIAVFVDNGIQLIPMSAPRETIGPLQRFVLFPLRNVACDLGEALIP